MGGSAERHRRWRQRRREQGICQHCPNPSRLKQDGTFSTYCQACWDRESIRKKARYVRKGFLQKRPQGIAVKPGPTWCLRCEQTFDSPDVREVRICTRCRPWYQMLDIDPEWAALGI